MMGPLRQTLGPLGTHAARPVVLVTRVETAASHVADWLFDRPVTALGNVEALKVNGVAPTATEQQFEQVLRCTYAAPVLVGQPWSISEELANVTLPDNHRVPFPQSGQVIGGGGG